jgi:hypothetical protein
MDSRQLLRVIRAILAGDFKFETPSYRTSTGVALFLAGMGTGVLLGVLLAPASDSRSGGVKKDGSGSGEFATRPKEPSGEAAVQSKAERSAS